MEHRHIIINEDSVRSVDFQAIGFGNSESSPKDRNNHADTLRRSYQNALEQSTASRLALDIPKDKKSSGSYLEVDINESIEIDALNTARGAKLMNIKKPSTESDKLTATLFLPDQNKEWLNKKLDDYSNPEKDTPASQMPANAKLINNIEDIEVSTVLDLFTQKGDKTKFERYTNGATGIYEVWVIKGDAEFDKEDLFARFDLLEIEHSQHCVVFTETAVALVKTTKEKLTNLVFAIDNLSELRIFKQASTLLSANMTEQTEWVRLIQEATIDEEAQVRIGILDSGVNNAHPLLRTFLPDERCHNATSAGPRDMAKHGTLMAGLVLYGDLTELIHDQDTLVVNTDLSSVKIMPGRGETPNIPELYGVIAEDAIITARDDNAIIQCSAITADGDTYGEPSSWSSAIDETLFNNGNADALLFVSAGNIEYTEGLSYPDYNALTEVKDPAQSWNAITVGAYTEKCIISDPNYNGIVPIAPRGGLSPYSTTSMLWNHGLIKPEILMEGGNAIDDNGRLSSAPDDINLTSTSGHSPVRHFDAMYATSAATALAARLAAKIKCKNPDLSPLSIRALMIHSAEWTDEMKRQNTDENGRLDIHNLVHTCGYGVPTEKKAIVSEDCYATFIAEQTMTPLAKATNGKYKLNAMHIFDLPWPKEILESMGDEEVKLRITLSYYIQPAPGSKTRHNKYRYPSLRLRFEVNKPTEDEAQFIRRVSHVEMEGVEASKNDTARWEIGIQERNNGCIISDYIIASAVDIASCNRIAVFPASGWWNSRKYTEDKIIKYSLIVSLETEETNIYNSIAQMIDIEI